MIARLEKHAAAMRSGISGVPGARKPPGVAAHASPAIGPVAPPRPPLPPEILALWDMRACFVCGKLGQCRHREIEVAMAELHAINAILGAA